MWQATNTAMSTGSRAEIFARYRSTSTWQEWDDGVKSVSLSGPFQAGTTGTLTPSSGPKARITLSEVVEDRGFTTVTRLPGATMTFVHTLEDTHDGRTGITHTLTISGPMTFLFAIVVGRAIARDLPRTVQTLAAATASSEKA